MLNNFNKNSIDARYNRKKINFNQINQFNFEKGLISKNDKQNKFINFFKDKNEEGYKIIEEYYIRYLYNDYSFLDEFELNELTKSDRTDRLLSIIKNMHGIKYNNQDLQYILKLNNTRDKKIHFFIRKNKNNLTLLLIDLYHLGIFGTYYIKGKPQHNSIEKTYKRNIKNTIPLEEFKTGKTEKELQTSGV